MTNIVKAYADGGIKSVTAINRNPNSNAAGKRMALCQRTGAPHGRRRACEIKHLLTECCPSHEKIILVMDNLNTHVLASLYKCFPAPEARSYAKRLEIHYTPKHGNWLNIAEIELNAMTRQCLARRLMDLETVRQEVSAWENMRNEDACKVTWHFTADDARRHIFAFQIYLIYIKKGR